MLGLKLNHVSKRGHRMKMARENGYSRVDLSNMWLLKPLTHNTTWFLASLISLNMISTQNLSRWARRKAWQVYEIRRLPAFRWIFRSSGDGPNRVFLYTNEMWHDLSMIFNEIVLSNKFSFEPQHYLEDSYIPIFVLIHVYTLNCSGCRYWNIA